MSAAVRYLETLRCDRCDSADDRIARLEEQNRILRNTAKSLLRMVGRLQSRAQVAEGELADVSVLLIQHELRLTDDTDQRAAAIRECANLAHNADHRLEERARRCLSDDETIGQAVALAERELEGAA